MVANSGSNATDAATGATLSSHQAHTITWNCRDASSILVTLLQMPMQQAIKLCASSFSVNNAKLSISLSIYQCILTDFSIQYNRFHFITPIGIGQISNRRHRPGNKNIGLLAYGNGSQLMADIHRIG